MKKTSASLFTGGGGADLAALQAGFTPVWGIEINPKIVAWASSQLDHPVHCLDLLEADPTLFEKPYHLHASPPCPSFSVANKNKGETENDLALARKVAEFIRVLDPQVFTLENVWGYRKSQSWAIIAETLDEVYPFGWDVNHVNFADYGVPQIRKRMIVRASKNPLPLLPEKTEWLGWYQAVEDLLPDLPDSQLAPWQLRRLPDVLRTMLVGGGSAGRNIPTADSDTPSITIKANEWKAPSRAILIEGDAAGQRPPTIIDKDEPSFTMKTSGGGRVHRAVLMGQGTWSSPIPEQQPAQTITQNSNQSGIRATTPFRVVALSTRCLARFQTFPDWYELPPVKTLACTIIGNAVPVEGMVRILKDL